MNTRFLKPAALMLASLGAAAFSFGGWAVITVDDLPRSLTIGQPVSIAFTVRQHGMKPLDGLKPTVVAASENKVVGEVQASAIASGPTGHYVANLVVPQRGRWTVTINSGFMASRITLSPIPASAAGTRIEDHETPVELGRRLFIAKGCVTCHVHGAVEGYESASVGPDLTPKRYQTDYLAKLLADPSSARTPGQQRTMPNLELKTSEIARLVAFINADRVVSAR
jgi:mono/diheme cytochrome c family protein